MIHRLASLINKELIQFTRDRILLTFVLVGPAIQLIMLGRAISQDIQDIPVAVIDYDLSPLSREIVTALDNTRELVVAFHPDNLQEARTLMDDGDVMAVMVIPRGFMAGTRTTTEVPQIQVFLDGVSSLIASRTLMAAQGAVQSLAEDVVITGNSPPPGGIRLYVDALFNRALDFRPHSITAQLAFITFQTATLVAVMGVVREREIGTIEMLTITPLKRLELIAGKAITPLLVGIIDFLIMFTVTQVVFHVPFRGSFPLFFGLTILYLMCEICYALVISTIARSQQQAVTLIFVWAMVAMTLSGYLVPITRLPVTMQRISWFIPLRHYLAIVRSLMLKGAGLLAVWQHALAIGFLVFVMTFVTTRTLSRVIE